MNYFIRFICIMGWIICLIGCNPSKINNRCDEFNKAFQDSSSSLYKRSKIEKLNIVLKKNPGCIDALLTRGDYYFSIDSLDLAKTDFKKVLYQAKSNIISLYKLGLISYLQDDHLAAIGYFEDAISKKSSGNIVFDFGSSNSNVAIDPYDISYIEIAYWLGKTYYYNNNPNRALELFNDCISHKYNLPDSYLFRGGIFIGIGKKNEACRDFDSSAYLGNSVAKEFLTKYQCR